jgi:hypothetical protein
MQAPGCDPRPRNYAPCRALSAAFSSRLCNGTVERINSLRSASYHEPLFRNLTKCPDCSVSSVNKCFGPGEIETWRSGRSRSPGFHAQNGHVTANTFRLIENLSNTYLFEDSNSDFKYLLLKKASADQLILNPLVLCVNLDANDSFSSR